MPLRFFRSRTFTGANIDAFMIAFLITGVAFFMTLYQQNIHGFSAIRTGLALLPMVVVMMVFSPISGTLVNRIGPRAADLGRHDRHRRRHAALPAHRGRRLLLGHPAGLHRDGLRDVLASGRR